jgi:hypothetical protein
MVHILCSEQKHCLLQGASGYVAVFDLLSSSSLIRFDLKSVPLEMCFSPDGNYLVVAAQVGGREEHKIRTHIHA